MALKLFILCHKEEFVIHRETGDKYFFYSQISQKQDGPITIQIRLMPENRDELISVKTCETWDAAKGIIFRAAGFFEQFDKFVFLSDDFYDEEKILEALLSFSATL